MKKWGLYQWSIIVFFIIVPVTATMVDYYLFAGSNDLISIAFKWFVFSGIGLRLLSAGIKQAVQPQYTAQEIFDMFNENANPIIRELGFANICFGMLAITSLFIPSFAIPSCLAGGLYFGLAGVMHILKKKDSNEEIFAMISDIYIFVILTILLILRVR